MNASSNRIPSRQTWAMFGAVAGVVVLSAVLNALQVGGAKGGVAAADIGEVIAAGASAIVMIVCAYRLGIDRLGRPWLLIGLGALSYAIGDTIWTIIEVGQGREVPYPGPSDIFYLLEYPLFACGILLAAVAFRGIVPFKRPAIIAIVTVVVLTAVVYVGLLRPTVWGAADLPTAEKVISTLYPLGDVIVMIGPAVFMIGVVRQLGRGKLAWPWAAVAAGTVMIAASDVIYSWLTAYNLYHSGAMVDYGWGLGHALLMLGALIALDLARPAA